ncbi:hypothetical protein [Hyphomonas sp. KY3]|uniref:GAP1-N1 domain-containing protein n=1 Tax=Hyphomonas sp. KY3 TaxID=2016196 RepID=UPI002112786E|nr:hypothetical protein [Hyphomonas sp. KY3]
MREALRFTLNQAFHGYNDGHRMLASSIPLAPADMRLMAYMSDRAADSGTIPQRGYITGYPLVEAGAYVLARTWPAIEVSRPGSVWTHSLLVDFSDLGQMEELGVLLAYHRRAQLGDGWLDYSKPVHFSEQNLDPHLAISTTLARKIIEILYTEYSETVVLDDARDPHLEATLMAVWSQQWPRLRRSLRFCTFTERNRTLPNMQFDLIVTDAKWRSSGQHGSEILNEDSGSWLDLAISDLVGQVTGFRQFLKRAASDISNGRQRFSELCRLYSVLYDRTVSYELVPALDFVLGELTPQEGRFLRSQTMLLASKHIDELDSKRVLALADGLGELAITELDLVGLQVATKVWAIDPSYFDTDEEIPLLRYFDRMLETLPGKAVIDGLIAAPGLLPKVLLSKPTILEDQRVWDGAVGSAAIDAVASVHDAEAMKGVLYALVKAQRPELAEQLSLRVEPGIVAKAALQLSSDVSSRIVLSTLEGALRHIGSSDRLLNSVLEEWVGPVSKRALHVLARRCSDVRKIGNGNNRSEDALLRAYTISRGDLARREELDFSIWFYLRAHFSSDACVPDLIKASFDLILRGIRQDELTTSQWRRVVGRNSRTSMWEWSRERPFVRNTAELICKHQVKIDQLADITSSPQDMLALLKAISYKSAGVKYLKSLRRELSSKKGIDTGHYDLIREFIRDI